MDHPSIVKAIHRFFNPASHYELSQLEKTRGEIPASEYERRKAALLNPNSTSFAQVYAMLGLSILAVAIVTAMVISRS